MGSFYSKVIIAVDMGSLEGTALRRLYGYIQKIILVNQRLTCGSRSEIGGTVNWKIYGR